MKNGLMRTFQVMEMYYEINNVYMKEELISVLIPTYNVEKYVAEAVGSILNQTYMNIEVIIVDDCSTDNTYSILSKIANSDNRIFLYKNNKNSKIVHSLNFALSKASGRYIARMDGDDICESDRLEKQMSFLKNNPDISLVGSAIKLVSEDGSLIKEETMPTEWDVITKCIKYSSPVLHIWLAKREVYDRLESYRIPGVEDYDFLLRLLTEGYKFTNIKESLYSVRIREGNTISTLGLTQRKLFNYTRRLYFERLSNGVDSYSYQSYLKVIKKNNISSKLFNISSKLLNIFICNRRSLLSLFSLFASVLFSPYLQIQYFYNRFMYKKITK